MNKLNFPKAELRKMVKKGIAVFEIAEYYNCHHGTISRLLREYGISHPGPGWRGNKTKVPISKNVLIKKYQYENKSDFQIAKELGISYWSVIGRRHEYNISSRSHSEAQILAWDSGSYESRNSPFGKRHHWYVNGSCLSDPDYVLSGRAWRQARSDVNYKYNSKCTNCKSCGDIYGRLYVHHILPRRYFCDVNDSHDSENLILLCDRCHAIADRSFPDFSEKWGEFRERLKQEIVKVTLSQAKKEISRKVQRLRDESSSFIANRKIRQRLDELRKIIKAIKRTDNNFSTSSPPERDDIVRAA